MELTQGVRFDTLELSPEILRALMERNIIQSTPVQAGCIPPMLAWRDVIAKAPTGTGKTFAYGIPIVEHIDPAGRKRAGGDSGSHPGTGHPDHRRTAGCCATFKPGVRAVCLYGGAAHRQADRRAEKASPDRGGHPGPAHPTT